MDMRAGRTFKPDLDAGKKITAGEHQQLERFIKEAIRTSTLVPQYVHNPSDIEANDAAYYKSRASGIYALKYLDAQTVPSHEYDHKDGLKQYSANEFMDAFSPPHGTKAEGQAVKLQIQKFVDDAIAEKIAGRGQDTAVLNLTGAVQVEKAVRKSGRAGVDSFEKQ